ncbi:MAG: hypothetical protein ABIY70_17055 [Capsulimonas sp.]|uniref:hypothetical protein n=1 Tax=Capsulimonas sp. TaxID=2494211 RepID=UPI0032677A52
MVRDELHLFHKKRQEFIFFCVGRCLPQFRELSPQLHRRLCIRARYPQLKRLGFQTPPFGLQRLSGSLQRRDALQYRRKPCAALPER